MFTFLVSHQISREEMATCRWAVHYCPVLWAQHQHGVSGTTHRPHLVTQEIRFCFQTNQMPLTNRSVLLGQEKISGRLPHILPCQAICKCQSQKAHDDLPKCIGIPMCLNERIIEKDKDNIKAFLRTMFVLVSVSISKRFTTIRWASHSSLMSLFDGDCLVDTWWTSIC